MSVQGSVIAPSVSGADIFVCETEDTRAHIIEGDCEGGETVYSRIYPLGQNEVSKSVVDSKHSLFLTSIVVNVDWWNSLDSNIQQIFSEAALEAARNERALSLEDGETSLKKLQANGVSVINLSQEDMDDLRKKTESVYTKYAEFFEPGLVASIRRLH
jgi:TRAP-type C4-dicarboxylate transport system substrate-binding protein